VNKEVWDRLTVSFPKDAERFRKAFDTGRYNMVDTGPYLARVNVWKQQVEVHMDKNDEGPAASFPLGYYSGGALCFPDLGVKIG
jgi:hypothetical protein